MNLVIYLCVLVSVLNGWCGYEGLYFMVLKRDLENGLLFEMCGWLNEGRMFSFCIVVIIVVFCIGLL